RRRAPPDVLQGWRPPTGEDLAMTDDPRARQVLDAIDELHRAVFAGDAETLDRLLGDDLTYDHSTGRMQRKAEALPEMVDWRPMLRTAQAEVRLFGDVAVVNAKVGAIRPDSYVLVLMVWHHRDGRWQMIARQSTALPGWEPVRA